MTARTVRIATRGSALAVAQTRLAAERLMAAHPDVRIEVITIETRGDRQQHAPLWKLEGYGFFTTQVEAALLDGRADVAVHSFKDMPTQADERLTVAAIFERRFPEDAVAAAPGVHRLDDLTEGAKVGTSSPRRIAQLKGLRPDLEATSLRGNVETRLQKVRDGEYDAVILARAGLERLGLGGEIAFCFDPTEFVPAPAQGALAIQTRADDATMRQTAACLHDTPTALAVEAERAVLSALHPGCHAPVGVYARLKQDELEIFALAAGLEGWPCLRRQVCGPKDTAAALAAELIEQLRQGGVEAILKPFEGQR
jgi:hydroxymethylbilane synthase